MYFVTGICICLTLLIDSNESLYLLSIAYRILTGVCICLLVGDSNEDFVFVLLTWNSNGVFVFVLLVWSSNEGFVFALVV